MTDTSGENTKIIVALETQQPHDYIDFTDVNPGETIAEPVTITASFKENPAIIAPAEDQDRERYNVLLFDDPDTLKAYHSSTDGQRRFHFWTEPVVRIYLIFDLTPDEKHALDLISTCQFFHTLLGGHTKYNELNHGSTFTLPAEFEACVTIKGLNKLLGLDK